MRDNVNLHIKGRHLKKKTCMIVVFLAHTHLLFLVGHISSNSI